MPAFPSWSQKMKTGADALTAEVVEAMTTNETFFFRDKLPFDHLKEAVLPALAQARAARRSLRIWCAASSTGQEPYSIAMCLKEAGKLLAGWRTEIVATDLSLAVLEKSKAGIFSQFEVQRGLPIQMLMKYFTQNGELWQLSAEIRGMVQHRQLNLLQDFSHLGTFDIIFCRNVLIYFDQATKANIFERIARMLEPDGVLALGAANPWSESPTPSNRIRTGAGFIARMSAPGSPGVATSGAAGAEGSRLGALTSVLAKGTGSREKTREIKTHFYRIACGTKREVFPVIGFSSWRIDNPHGV